MGAAARKIAYNSQPARPALRLVHGKRTARRARISFDPAEVFRVVAICFTLLAIAGSARVFLAASAAEASIDAWSLRADVKAERLVTRSLEADRSTLAAPSRIEQIASQTLNMTRPSEVSYLELPSDIAASGTQVPAAEQDTSGSDLIATLVDLAAEEAQVMLVGDVGLGSLR